MVMVMVKKGEREWEGGEHDDYWCCVMSLKGWRKIQGSLWHPSLIWKRKRLIGMCLTGRKLWGISQCQLFHAPPTLVAKEKEIWSHFVFFAQIITCHCSLLHSTVQTNLLHLGWFCSPVITTNGCYIFKLSPWKKSVHNLTNLCHITSKERNICWYKIILKLYWLEIIVINWCFWIWNCQINIFLKKIINICFELKIVILFPLTFFFSPPSHPFK